MNINPNKIRPTFEQVLYEHLLKNKAFRKSSERKLGKISSDHTHETHFDFLTNGVLINEINSNELFAAFNEVKKILGVNKKVIDLFIANDLSVNAGIVFLGGSKYIIYLNSALVNLLTLNEIKFVIGHELGHLKYKHHKIIKDHDKKIQPSTLIRLYEHSRYAEIAADRCGLLACKSIENSKTTLMKLASGTNLSFLSIRSSGFKNQLDSIKKSLLKNNSLINEKLSHPYSLIRIYALEKFYNAMNKDILTNEHIVKIDEEIFSTLKYLNPKMNKKMDELLIYACLWVSYSHKKNLKLERETIENLCDPVTLNKITAKSKNIENKKNYYKNLFTDTLCINSQLSLSEKSGILDKVCSIALADNFLQIEEKNTMNEIIKLLGINKSYLESIIKKLSS